MTIVFTAYCHVPLGAALAFTTRTNNNNKSFQNRPVQSNALLRSPTRPHHQCRPTTTAHKLKQPPEDLDCGRPSHTPAGSYSYRTVTEPRLIQSQASQASPRLINARLFLDCPALYETVQPVQPVQSFQPVLPVLPVRPALCALDREPPRQSRLVSVPCHRPRLLCTLAPIWSCHSIFTALPTPDLVACLLARSLATRQSQTVHSPTPTSPSHYPGGSQNTSRCLGHLLSVAGTSIHLSPRPSHSHRPVRTGRSRQLGRSTGGRAGRWRRQFGPKTPCSHRRVATHSS